MYRCCDYKSIGDFVSMRIKNPVRCNECREREWRDGLWYCKVTGECIYRHHWDFRECEHFQARKNPKDMRVAKSSLR